MQSRSGVQNHSQDTYRHPPIKKDIATLFSLFYLIFTLGIGGTAAAEVSEPIVSDVTTRAFSVIWSSDEPVIDATVKVFSDESGTTELTTEFTISLISEDYPPALAQGIVKVDIVGLESDATYYFQTQTQTVSATISSPVMPPLPSVHTAAITTIANSANQPIVNDLILNRIYQPDGTTPAEGTLMIVRIPEVSDYPLSAFVGENIDAPFVIVDLNNLFDASGTSAEVPPDAVMEITEFRGTLCDPDTHELIRMRRTPEHEEDPPITELEDPIPCFSPNAIGADFSCDGRIGAGDFNLFLAQFGLQGPDCRYNSDFDLNTDDRVGAGDFNLFLSVFGNTE